MKFAITLLSYPILLWAYFRFPLLNQFDWKWLLLIFFVYCYQLLRILDKVIASPQNYGYKRSSSNTGGMDGGSGGFFDGGGGGDCGGGGD